MPMNGALPAFVRENLFFLLVLAVIAAAFLLFRTKGTKLESVSEFDALIGTGVPVVVQFYSNT
jgi:hypothetical protein